MKKRVSNFRSAFTMAEILLSLTIIGVVAAITLPSLTGNINERTWNTQRKALYARMSQAFALMQSLNGYGTLTEETSNGAGDGVDTAAETFITAGLSKVLKINNICSNDKLADCGIATKVTTLAASQLTSFPATLADLNPNNTSVYDSWSATTSVAAGSNSYSQINSKAAAFETANGESIALYYNPTCSSAMGETMYFSQKKMCVNMVYDLNGTKGPNTVGKDIGFISVFYPTDSIVVAPFVMQNDASSGVEFTNANGLCKDQDSETRMPTALELGSMFTNRNLIGNMNEQRYWSSSILSSSEVYYITNRGAISGYWKDNSNAVRCVRR